MVEMLEKTDVGALPLAPKNPLPYRQRLKALRVFHTGMQTLRYAGGPLTRFSLGPRWLMPPIVLATSPQGGHDILGRTDTFIEKTVVHAEMRRLPGNNLFDLTNEPWLPRRRALQPIFTKQHVRAFAGHMSQAAETVCASWVDGAEIDLDAECRRLTLRAPGRSVLGLNLDERADALAEPLRVALEYIANRSLRPLRTPRWLPTPAHHRARAAGATMRRLANDILQACRADPTRDAPLVQALIAAADPATGRGLSDGDICNDLLIFLGAGHEIQARVTAEVAAIGDRQLIPKDIFRLGSTVQVLHEALRLCPPGAAISRTAVQDIEIDGHRVEAGSVVVYGIYGVHRDPTLWDHPLVFDPDHFRHAGGHPRAGHHHPAHRNHLPRPGFSGRRAVHHRRRSIDLCPRPCAHPKHLQHQLNPKEDEMKYVVAWTLRLNGSAAENEAAVRRGLELYANWTPPASTTFHQFVGRLDGAGGFSVVETDNPADLADAPSKFGAMLDYQIYPVVDIAEWAQALQSGAEFRESIS